MLTLFNLCLFLLNCYTYIITAYIILTWLYNLNLLVNAPLFIHNIAQAIYRIVEPALNKIRYIMPASRSGIDFSPFVLYLIIWIIRSLLIEYGTKFIL